MKPEDFEIFLDPSYYDMWCLKPKASKDFNLTMHFTSNAQASHALAVMFHWFGKEK